MNANFSSHNDFPAPATATQALCQAFEQGGSIAQEDLARQSEGPQILTTSKKRKFNQISSTASQLESLNLDSRFGGVNSKTLHSGKDAMGRIESDDKALPGQSSKRRRVNELTNTIAEQLHHIIALKRENSKEKRAPFSSLYHPNTANIQAPSAFLSKERQDGGDKNQA